MEEILTLIGDYEKDKTEEFLKIIDEMELSKENKLQGLIYIAYKAKKITLDEIERQYPDEYPSVFILAQLYNLNFSLQNEEAENLRKMFFAITKDIRIIMMKIALAVASLRHADNKTEQEKQNLANSIFTIYAPLSARLGLSTFKTELENGAFKLKDPDTYNKIQQEVDNRFHKRQPIVESLVALVEKCMKDLDIAGKVYGRKKHIYSIYKKLEHHSLDNMYDLVAVRAIVGTIPECYALLGKLHAEVEPFKNRFKDYIATPKPNGYMSLHTTVIFQGFPVEIQIRTKEMHQYAEYGIAAHWLYKEKRISRDTLDLRLAWLRQMMENENVSIDDLATSLNKDIYSSEIFVQTPKGKVIYLPNSATTLDFAYAIHSEIGNKCVGAKVNGKMVPTNTKLRNADVVEIITNPNSKGPSRDWLTICVTNEAKSKINSFFKKNMKDETIKLGKTMLENAIKEKGYSVSKLTSNEIMLDVLKYYNMNEAEDLYANIGTNAISAKNTVNKLVAKYQKLIKEETKIELNPTTVSLNTPSEKQISVKGLNNVLLKFANCCHPMYGDDIIGFISAGRGIIIHRAICPNIAYFNESRMIEAGWKDLEKVNKTKNKIKTEK